MTHFTISTSMKKKNINVHIHILENYRLLLKQSNEMKYFTNKNDEFISRINHNVQLLILHAVI